MIVLRSFSRFGSIWIQKNVQYGRSFLIYLTTSFNPSARFLRFLRIFLSESSIAYENLEPTSLKTLLVPKSLLDSPGFKIFLSFNISRNFIVISLSIGWNPWNFKIFIFKPKLSFLRENHKNRINSRISTNSPYIWFLEMALSRE